ncbi:MAG: hypothetical protein FD167_6003 [bacterium]|nr:MAG: hypothetical protein FD167_6003 [bacterium]
MLLSSDVGDLSAANEEYSISLRQRSAQSQEDHLQEHNSLETDAEDLDAELELGLRQAAPQLFDGSDEKTSKRRKAVGSVEEEEMESYDSIEVNDVEDDEEKAEPPFQK